MIIKRKKGRFIRNLGRVFVITGVVCFAAVIIFDVAVKPTLIRLLGYQCSIIAERILSDAVFLTLGDELESYDDIVSFTFDNDGKITALNTSQTKINRLKALLNETINEAIPLIENEKVGISFGTLTGISYLYGTGHELVFNVEPQGSATTRLISTFDDAGINQTVHSIVLEASVELSPMIPGFSDSIEIVSDFIISQTVLIGDVPDSYSYIVLDEGSVGELADIDI